MIGLLWRITNPKQSLQDAIREASKRFSEKFGVWPGLVLCNSLQLAEAAIKSEHIQADKLVSPNYLQLWGAIVICPNCGRPNSDRNTTCWKCGARLK